MAIVTVMFVTMGGEYDLHHLDEGWWTTIMVVTFETVKRGKKQGSSR